jgi:glutathione peroxidase
MRKVLLLFVAAALTVNAASGAKTKANMDKKMATKDSTADYLKIPFKTIDGKETSLQAFNGKVVLLVNVASECGYTPQYKGLEALYEKYKDKGLVVVGFPANNFGQQEPGTDEQIKEFCTSKFNVTFPMMSKISVAGTDQHPLYNFLTEKSPLPGPITWNFNKFLLDRSGHVINRWPSKIEPMSDIVTSQVEKILGDKVATQTSSQ